METSVAVSVFEHATTVRIIHTKIILVILHRLLKIVPVDEIIARVVGRIDIDHLHLAEIALLQEFQHFQIVTLNIEVLRAVPVDALFLAGAQSFADGFVCLHDGNLFAHPSKLIGNHIIRQHLTQQVKVNGLLRLAGLIFSFGYAIREQRPNFLYIPCGHINRFHAHFIHFDFLRFCNLQFEL